MNFIFHFKGSKIYDFLQFPRFLYYNTVHSEISKDENISNIAKKDYLALVKRIQNKLTPFSKEIEFFYTDEVFNDLDYFEFYIKFINILECESVDEYIEQLISLSEQEINECIIKSLLTSQNERLIEVPLNNNQMIEFIKNLDVEPSLKWNLYLIVEEPKKYMRRYVDLMKKIRPIFEEIYRPFTDEVKEYGNSLVRFLNTNGDKGLAEISYSYLDANFFKGEQWNLLISILFPYCMSMKDYSSNFVWGLRLEEIFKQIHKISKDKINKQIQIFKNIGDKTRYEVLKLISIGITSTKEIANRLGVSSATISYHINALFKSNVIKIANNNKKFCYVINYHMLHNVWTEFIQDLNFPNSLK